MAEPDRRELDLASEPIRALDGSEIWVMTRVDGASSIHMRLPADQVSKALRHRTVSELWFFVEGEGQFWRAGVGVEDVREGSTLNIPVGAGFQFRSVGERPLRAWIATIPPWPEPDDDETVRVEGPWSPTVGVSRQQDHSAQAWADARPSPRRLQ